MAAPTKDQAPGFVQYQLPPDGPVESPIRQTATGVILQNGEFASLNYVKGISGWKLDAEGNFEAVNGTFSGTLSGISFNIPDATTANSFHTDSNGNSWWGANVATGYTGANAYILNTGAAVFKSVQIGGTTIQYVITNSGIFSYGDGEDGAVVISVNTTLTRDMNYTDLTVNSGVTLNTGSYRIFVTGTLTLNGTISRSGNNASGTTGGAALADGYLKGSQAGGAGGGGGSDGSNGSPGGTGGSVTNSLGTTGFAGGVGGDAGLGVVLFGGAAGAAGSWSIALVKLKVGVQLAELLDVTATGSKIKYNNSSASGGGGGGAGGGGGSGNTGGNGGGAGSAGGIIAIYARTIVISATGSIVANGGNGANATNGSAGAAACGGGGSAGNGGVIILTYNQLTNGGSITVTAGTKGIKGTGPFTINATDGTNGSAGTIYQFGLSL